MLADSTANLLALAGRCGIAHNNGAGGELLLVAQPAQLDRFAQALSDGAHAPWPQERDVARCGDMGTPERSRLRVLLDGDNDVIVEVVELRDHEERPRIAAIEFCTPGAGGGASPKTRAALVALMRAIEADNAAAPHKQWPPR